MPQYVHTFTAVCSVAFAGQFPVDMLRYDACYPRDSDAVTGICESLSNDIPTIRGQRIELIRVDNNKSWTPTVARWKSFGWEILNINTRK